MRGFAIIFASALMLGCVGNMGETNTLRFENLTDDPGQPALFGGSQLGRPVAVNATIELKVSSVVGWHSVVDSKLEPSGIFIIESHAPLRLRAVAEGTATLEVTTASGASDRIKLSARAIETVEVDIHRSTLIPELPSPLYESWATPNGFALRPDHLFALEAIARDADGQILMGFGAVEWTVSDDTMVDTNLNLTDNTFDVSSLGIEGDVTISAGYGSSFVLQLTSDAPADHLVAYDLEGAVITNLVQSVGQGVFARVYAYDAEKRLLIGSRPEETALTLNDNTGVVFSDAETSESALQSFGLLLLSFDEAGEATLTISASGAHLDVPLTVYGPNDPLVATP